MAARHGRRGNTAGAAVRATCSEIAIGSALRAESRLIAARHGIRSNFGEAAVQTERSEIIASSVVRTGRDNRKPHKVVIIAIANAILKTGAVWRQQLNR